MSSDGLSKKEQQWQEVAESPEAQTALYLQSRFHEMRAVRSAPSLFSINGFGTSLCGARDHDPESGTYVKTHTICLLFVPVLALGAYRVAKAESGGGWHLIGKVRRLPAQSIGQGSRPEKRRPPNSH